MLIKAKKSSIILATSNQHKMQEIASIYNEFQVLNYTELMKPITIDENGTDFAANATIKAKTVFDGLNNDKALVLADDSGLCVASLDNKPGIYSARFAGLVASDAANNAKLIHMLQAINQEQSKAFFVCALALCSKAGVKVVHGNLHGTVSTVSKGVHGFGYDPLFTPKGYKQSLAEMPASLKNQISHRTRALDLMRYLL